MEKNKSMNINWSKDMIEMGFAQEVGKCIFADTDIDFGDSKMKMRLNICRTSEDELTMSGGMEVDGELVHAESNYRRNVSK